MHPIKFKLAKIKPFHPAMDEISVEKQRKEKSSRRDEISVDKKCHTKHPVGMKYR
ncbi:MAG: hypothetical protein H7122_14015 [Chitinophagaceae bacterium]|nr:hypothetical protein [Chitinophagaceae bacterium]